jgi:hypothetical protein
MPVNRPAFEALNGQTLREWAYLARGFVSSEQSL